MLELKIDIIPYGEESLRKNLETIQIVNNGKNKKRPEFGDYKVLKSTSETWPSNLEEISINNHRRKDGYWPLIKKVASFLMPVKQEG
jgi:hypothetical protein